MLRRLLNLMILLMMPLLMGAQAMSVESFRKLDTDMDARINFPEKDPSGRTCAIIKVVTPNTGFVFDTGTVSVVKTHQGVGEIWVYVQPGVKKFIVNHPTLGVMRDYYLPMPIESATVYELRLLTANVPQPSTDSENVVATDKNVVAADKNADPVEFTVNGVTFRMIPVEGGTFTMGATGKLANNAFDDETPTHQVTLSDYMIGETEVTQALWEAVMGSNPSNWYRSNLPVEQVSWDDCQDFIEKLNSLIGQNFRLPTEAEWEYAAKGGKKAHGYLYSGSDDIGSVAWYYGNSGSKTHPVGTKAPNELGIYDMTGNVWEWCSDWAGYYSSSSQNNPTGPASGHVHICRGGYFNIFPEDCRVSWRYVDGIPADFVDPLGLRLALDR